jgi:hypothetical protein
MLSYDQKLFKVNYNIVSENRQKYVHIGGIKYKMKDLKKVIQQRSWNYKWLIWKETQ